LIVLGSASAGWPIVPVRVGATAVIAALGSREGAHAFFGFEPAIDVAFSRVLAPVAWRRYMGRHGRRIGFGRA
jgi:hypothetical protein